MDIEAGHVAFKFCDAFGARAEVGGNDRPAGTGQCFADLGAEPANAAGHDGHALVHSIAPVS